MSEPTRILYFGSREWIDVPANFTPLEVRAYIRRMRIVPVAWRLRRWQQIDEVLGHDARCAGRVVVIEGEADGADLLSAIVARSLGQAVEPFAINDALDGRHRGAPFNRNERMLRDGRPHEARGFIVGAVGSPFSRGSLDMYKRLRSAGVRTLVHRDDGIEPTRCARCAGRLFQAHESSDHPGVVRCEECGELQYA